MDFGEILSRAWQIVWKYKVLWIFGILAGSTAGGNYGSSGVNYQFSGQDLPRRIEQFFNNIPDWQLTLGAFLIIGLVLLAIVLAVVLGTVGRIGVVRGTMRGDAEVERLSFGELFKSSLPYFWRVFGLNLLIFLGLLVIIFLLVGFIVLAGVLTAGIALICLLPLICLAVPISWFVSIIIEQANVALVVDDVSVFEGLRRGWQIVIDHIGEFILMGLILLLGGGLVSFLIGLPFAFLAFPIILSVAAGSGVAIGSSVSYVFLICLVLYLPVLLVLSGFVRAYIGSAWTLTYMRLTGRRPVETAPSAPELEPAV